MEDDKSAKDERTAEVATERDMSFMQVSWSPRTTVEEMTTSIEQVTAEPTKLKHSAVALQHRQNDSGSGMVKRSEPLDMDEEMLVLRAVREREWSTWVADSVRLSPALLKDAFLRVINHLMGMCIEANLKLVSTVLRVPFPSHTSQL